MATIGKTTLMLVAVTPRVLVLAWETGVAVVLDDPNSAAPALPDPPGVPAGARTSQAMSPTTMAMMMRAVRACVARGRRCMRQDPLNGARGSNAPRCAETSMLASIFTLLRGARHRRPEPSGRRRPHERRQLDAPATA